MTTTVRFDQWVKFDDACGVSRIPESLMTKLVAAGMVRVAKGRDLLVNISDVSRVLAQAFDGKGSSK
jgi:hypothetical protein